MRTCPLCGSGITKSNHIRQNRCGSCLFKKLRKYSVDNPWYKSLDNARTRCFNKKHNRYYTYGGRGITCLLSLEQVKILWFRDCASKLKRPSLDRIDPNGHYVFENCRFIELSENSRIGRLKNISDARLKAALAPFRSGKP